MRDMQRTGLSKGRDAVSLRCVCDLPDLWRENQSRERRNLAVESNNIVEFLLALVSLLWIKLKTERNITPDRAREKGFTFINGVKYQLSFKPDSSPNSSYAPAVAFRFLI